MEGGAPWHADLQVQQQYDEDGDDGSGATAGAAAAAAAPAIPFDESDSDSSSVDSSSVAQWATPEWTWGDGPDDMGSVSGSDDSAATSLEAAVIPVPSPLSPRAGAQGGVKRQRHMLGPAAPVADELLDPSGQVQSTLNYETVYRWMRTPTAVCSGIRPDFLREHGDVEGRIYKEVPKRRTQRTDKWTVKGGPKNWTSQQVDTGVWVKRAYGAHHLKYPSDQSLTTAAMISPTPTSHMPRSVQKAGRHDESANRFFCTLLVLRRD